MTTSGTETKDQTAETQLVRAADVDYAYRRFGRPAGLPDARPKPAMVTTWTTAPMIWLP